MKRKPKDENCNAASHQPASAPLSPPPATPPSTPSRRTFLKVSGASLVAAGVGSEIATFPARAQAQGSWKYEADIVVVGTGAAGSSAALNAHRLGNSVIMLESAPSYGGTTAKSGGSYWIPNNSLMRARGIRDSRDDALRYMVRVAYPDAYNPDDPLLGLMRDQFEALAAFYDNASDALEALHSMTSVQSELSFDADGEPDTDYVILPEVKSVRGRHLTPLKSGYVSDLPFRMKDAAQKRGIPILYNHRAKRLLMNPKGEMVGVEVAVPGQTETVRARKAVIFGSGGFSHNRELRTSFLRGPVFGTCAVPTNQGDFIPMATSAGAKLANMNNAWWCEAVLELALKSPNGSYNVFYIKGDSVILVNRYGRRFVNETSNYNDRALTHFSWDSTRNEYPNLLAFMIYDQRTAMSEKPGAGFPYPQPGRSVPYVFSGQTFGELASSIGARLEQLLGHAGNFRLDAGFGEQLRKTVERFNQFAERGVDEDFHRGETPYQRRFYKSNVRSAVPNPTMHPLAATGPYYAIILGPGTLDTKGGPKINSRAQVVDQNDRPIPGLYGAGNCVGFPAGQAYWGSGSTIGLALTFGYIAAREATKERVKNVQT